MTEHSRKIDADSSTERLDAAAVLGSLSLFFSAGVGLLAAIDRSSPLSFMPSSWHSHRMLWYFMAFGGLLAAFALMRPKEKDRRREQRALQRERSARPVFQSVILYTRAGCHLCDEAKTLLEEYDRDISHVTEIDIDSDPKLVEQFTTCVPVVEIDGKIRFRGKVNPVLLRRLIHAARRKRDSVEAK